jgi:hypothetical protein
MSQIRRSLLQEARKNPAFLALALGLLARRVLRRGGTRIAVECHPGIPNHKELIWKVALLADFRLFPPAPTPVERRDRLVLLYWGGLTGLPPAAHRWPSPEWVYALNANVRNTGKRNVARVFAQAFGYDLAVDPTRHVGQCVAKSDANSTHDGRLVACPIPDADPRLAYQLLIDNSVGPNEVLDLRVPVVGDELPFVYLKRRPVDLRFANRNSSVEVGATDDTFSSDEQASIRAFCRSMSLDLGELDILRDTGTGRVFIVDVNSMPFGPPKPIALKDGIRAVTLYADAFSRLADRWIEARGEQIDTGCPMPPPSHPAPPAG